MLHLPPSLGYNDFNNLVMQNLWWLPNKILRHIHKKRFSVFLGRFLRICNKSVQKVLKRAKKLYGYQKRRILRCFRIRLKSFEKMHPKKVISKNVTELYALFSLLLMFVKLVLLVHFLVHFFTTFPTDSKSAWNSAFFDIFFDFFQNFFFGSY
jgi:hypothetical protein